jgi:hypothetical protein
MQQIANLPRCVRLTSAPPKAHSIGSTHYQGFAMALTVLETRRENLRRLVFDRFEGKRSLFSRASGVHENQINLVLTNNETHGRNLGEKLACRIESSLSLSPGYLDQPQAHEELHEILCLPVPAPLLQIFRADDNLERIVVRARFLAILVGKITGRENLAAYLVATADMAPALVLDERVILDTAVKAVSADGVYVLQHGDTTHLRRVSKLLTGGWTIQSGSGASIHIDTLSGIDVLGKVVMVLNSKTV